MTLLRFHNRPPPAGHHYPVPQGPTLRADSTESLIAKLRQYRLNNGLPAGDPESDITAFYATKYPWWVDRDAEQDKTPPERSSGDYGAILWSWLNRVWASPPTLLADKDLEEDRNATCLQCSQFRELPKPDMESTRRITILGRGAVDNIGFCASHKWHNGLACKFKNAGKWGGDSPPGNCWVVTERENAP